MCGAQAARLFKAIDSDDDKLIDRKEFKAAHLRVARMPRELGVPSTHGGTKETNSALGGAYNTCGKPNH